MANISDFVKAISKLDREKSAQERFRDFCEMGYCAIAKPLAPTPERAEELEARYMHIVGTYKNKDTLRAYPELLAMVLEGVQERQDFLGIAAGELSMLDPTMGQFFTPVEVSRAMAAMMLPEDEVATLIYEKGYITVGEPAAGAGGMLLALTDVLEGYGYSPHIHMLVNAIDLGALPFYMCYIQLAFRGVPAFVERADTLRLESFEGAWTPAARVFQAEHGHLDFSADGQQIERQLAQLRLAGF